MASPPTETTGVPAPLEERPALRDEQVELTRQRILHAVIRILADNVADLTVEAVAREAGVSRPTVYRYFRSKRDMVEAVGRWYAEQTGTLAASEAETLEGMLAQVPGVFARYEALPPEVRAAALHIGRLDAAASYQVERLALSRRLVAPYISDLTAEEQERAAQVVTLLLSSGTLRSARHLLGASAVEAADLVTWTIRRLVGVASPAAADSVGDGGRDREGRAR